MRSLCFHPLYGVPNFYRIYKHISTAYKRFRPLYGVPNFYWDGYCAQYNECTVFVLSTGFLISTLSLIPLGKSILFIWFAGQTRKPDIFPSIKFHFLLKMPILQVSAQNYIFWYSILPIPMS